MRYKMFSAITVVVMFCAITCGSAYGQLMCSLGAMMPGQQGYNPYLDQPPAPRAANELASIYNMLCPAGCGSYVLVSNHTVPNAMAQAIGWGQTKIGYASGFMNHVAQRFGFGATFGILAHEFGHHIDFHTTPVWMNNSWSRELKADSWAGCALARANVGTDQIQNALRAIAAYPSPSHPGWPQRIQAVQSGFVACGGQWLNRYSFGY